MKTVLTMLLDALVSFVKHNPITCIVMVILAVSFPAFFKYAMWIVIAIAALFVILLLLLFWRLHKVRKDLEKQIRNAQNRAREYYGDGGSGEQSKEEGDISIHRTSSAPEKRINGNVGEYVDFEEE